MNVERLKMMKTMLNEVLDGTWKPSVCLEVTNIWDYDSNTYTSFETKGENEFDLASWINKDFSKKDCGFTACAVGHATLDKRFNDEGFVALSSNGTPSFGDETNWAAVETYFDFVDDSVACEFLFQNNYYNPKLYESPEQVIEQLLLRIDVLIHCGEEYVNNIVQMCFDVNDDTVMYSAHPDLTIKTD